MLRTLPRSEAMSLLSGFHGDLTDFSVGFSKAVRFQGHDKVELAGSGTLISTDKNRAILTAAHVLANLPTSGPVGLSVSTRLEECQPPVILEMEHTRTVVIAKGGDDAQGPDLGLIILSPTDWSRLPAGKAFFNLSIRRNKMMNDPHPPLRGMWVLCGMVGEWTNNPPQAAVNPNQKGFHGLCMPVRWAKERHDQDFDYLSIQVAKNELYQGPDSFGGCSGGGLWHLILHEQADGKLIVSDSLLTGVAFYQSGWEHDRNTIECHGRKSIYGKVIETLESLPA